MAETLTVTRLARRIRNLLEIDIGEVWVKGEISNLRQQSSGHWYFSLKDETTQISCAMFGAKRREGHEVIEDGAKVEIFGEVSFYEARGSTQLIVRKAKGIGLGDLQARFEALKKKLDHEGLFSAQRKKQLPTFPSTIGIVTSPTSAALQDMINVLSRRSPWLQVVLYPTAVQGKGAERQIAHAIHSASNGSVKNTPIPEALIVGRGGGSLEDLWNFNEEIVARAIADSPIPIISAVGHEIDFTISDFVADLRAPTPSAAAELIAPDVNELQQQLQTLKSRLNRSTHSRLERLAEHLDFYERTFFARSSDVWLSQPAQEIKLLKEKLSHLTHSQLIQKQNLITNYLKDWQRHHPRELLKRRAERISSLSETLKKTTSHSIHAYQEKLQRLSSLLSALGPTNILERGFSITLDQNGNVIQSPESLSPGDQITTKLRKGTIESTINEQPEHQD